MVLNNDQNVFNRVMSKTELTDDAKNSKFICKAIKKRDSSLSSSVQEIVKMIGKTKK